MPSVSAAELFHHVATDAMHEAVHPVADETLLAISQMPNACFANMDNATIQYCSCLASQLIHDFVSDPSANVEVAEEDLDHWQFVLQVAVAIGMQAQQLLHAGTVSLPASPTTHVVVLDPGA